ncbi:HNH endonuclease [Gordonia zhaorongruii]|uniref:HNH endonuclease n=1 Tax=Gordonia zhaorongruii TaxID=2597659 RepID=UPI0010512C2C|nr:HNH endonuclease signature motif containing protein [Gordonia zhaorongruii]
MAATLFTDTDPDQLTEDELAERLIGYASQTAALTARFLDYLAAFDTRHGWSGEGIASCAHWLSWRVGLSLRTAQDHVRVAQALVDLPCLRSRFHNGEVSYSKVRAITRIATPIRDEELTTFALSATAAQVERLVAGIRRQDRSEDPESEDEAPESAAHWSWKDDGTLAVSMRLTALDGARFLAAVVRAEYERTRTTADDAPLPTEMSGEADPNQMPHDLWRNVPYNVASAVVAMSDTIVDGVKMPEVAVGGELLIHEIDGVASLDEGPALRSAERDEAHCDASLRVVRHGEGDVMSVSGRRVGPILRWGRKRRVPNAALVRTVMMRDRSCQSPGCGRTRHLHIHHVQPWSEGGTTDPDNLILLCSQHHRALHGGQFSIKALGHQRFAFRGTQGEPLVAAPLHRAPDGWRPSPHVPVDGVDPTGGGRLDLGYATEVLYAAWQWKAERVEEVAAA